MDDPQIHDLIEKLVAEEQDLFGRVGEGGLNADEHNRLESIKVSLDQCWDLLRQRRAKREFGQSEDEAHARPESVVEHYRG
jgi:uncharacterized protein DUF2630